MNTLTVTAKNQPGILKAVTTTLFDAGVNIEFIHADTSETKDGATDVVVKSQDDLSAVTDTIKGMDGVVAVN